MVDGSARSRSRLIHDLFADVDSGAAAIALYGFGSWNKDFHSWAVFDIRPQANKVVADPANHSVVPGPDDYAGIGRCHVLTHWTKAGYWVGSVGGYTTFWPKLTEESTHCFGDRRHTLRSDFPATHCTQAKGNSCL